MASDTIIQSIADVLQWVSHNTPKSAIFRGQSDSDWSLSSRIARTSDGQKIERHLFSEFQRRARPYLDNEPKNDFEWLAIAQHHGLSTRLLDWTTSPIAALWFAAREHDKFPNRNARIWAFIPDISVTDNNEVEDCHKNPFEQASPVLIHPAQISARITAQSGCFTLQPLDPTTKLFVKLDSIESLVTSAVIPASCLAAILEELDRCSVNQMSLFPSLDSLAHYLNWQSACNS